MVFSPVPEDELYRAVAPLLEGMGLAILDWSFIRGKERMQLHCAVFAKAGVGVDDCSRAHRIIQARSEVLYGERDVYIEVASPGIDRTIKDASEFLFYVGKGVRCYRTDISDWTAGRIVSADRENVTIQNVKGLVAIPYGIIGKAKLDYSQEVED